MTYRTKLWAVNANWNDDGWNLNANSVENPNDWNADNQVFSCYSRLSSAYTAEVFFTISFLQPPIFLPIVSSSVPKDMYCSFDIKRFSQSNWTKNLMSSTFTIAISSNDIFCFDSEKEALLKAVSKSRKALSILEPSPKRSVRGIFLWIIIQDE